MAHQFTTAELSEIAFRHKYKIVFIPLLIGLLTVAMVIFFPRTYRSEARLFLQLVNDTGQIGRVATKPTQAKEDAVNAGIMRWLLQGTKFKLKRQYAVDAYEEHKENVDAIVSNAARARKPERVSPCAAAYLSAAVSTRLGRVMLTRSTASEGWLWPSRCRRMASRAWAIASTREFPAEKQPGRSGTTTPNACLSSPGSIAMG